MSYYTASNQYNNRKPNKINNVPGSQSTSRVPTALNTLSSSDRHVLQAVHNTSARYQLDNSSQDKVHYSQPGYGVTGQMNGTSSVRSKRQLQEHYEREDDDESQHNTSSKKVSVNNSTIKTTISARENIFKSNSLLQKYATPSTRNILPNHQGSFELEIPVDQDVEQKERGLSLNSEVSIESLNARLDRLEHQMSLFMSTINDQSAINTPRQQYRRVGKAKENLTTGQISAVGYVVKDEMFKAIKFIDASVEIKTRDELIDRVLRKNREPQEDWYKDDLLRCSIWSYAKLKMTEIKSHIKSNIRMKTTGKICFLFFIFC